MSGYKALGDYIHLHKNNYEKYGTFRKGEGKNSYQIYNDFLIKRTANLTTISPDTIAILRQRIANDAETKNERNTVEQKQYNERLEQIYKYIQQFTSTELLKDFQKNQGFNTKTKVQEFSNQFISPDYFEKGSIKPKQLENKIKLLKEIRDKIKDLNNNKIPATEENINDLNNKYRQLDIGVPLDMSIKSPICRIQTAIDNYSFDSVLSSVAGRFGEELVFSARDTALGIVGKNLQTAIQKEGVVGENKTSIEINKDLFAVNMSSIFKSADQNNNKYIINKTQDKVDVQIIVNREDVFSSVKDYFNTSSKPVTLQNEVSILYSLAFLQSYYEDFGNHWINMHALGFKDSNRTNADTILKQEIAYEALVIGNPFKQGAIPANTFIVIDRASGKVFIDNTKDILLKKFNQIEIKDKEIDNLNLQKQNKKASSFEERIIRILSYLHQVKLHVGYRTNFNEI